MTYKVIDIEGIGEVYAAKLSDAGITTVDILLENCRTPKLRQELADRTGISPSLILKWANHADLIRIDGIGPQFAELLEASGVDTVRELAHRNADNLHARMVEENERRHLTRRVPSAAELSAMIDEARTLAPFLTY